MQMIDYPRLFDALLPVMNVTKGMVRPIMRKIIRRCTLVHELYPTIWRILGRVVMKIGNGAISYAK